jgi:hypothetical protein
MFRVLVGFTGGEAAVVVETTGIRVLAVADPYPCRPARRPAR